MHTIKDYIKELEEVIIYLAICCYSEDKDEQEKVKHMAYNLNNIKDYLKGLVKD